MPYCTNCGNKALETDKFCNNCGTMIRSEDIPTKFSTIQPVTTFTPQPEKNEETVTIAISNIEKPKSFGRWDAYILLATQKSLLISQLNSQLINKVVMEARNRAKEEGKGFFGQWGAQLGTSFNYADRYTGWTRDNVLSEIPATITIPHDEITKIELKSTYNHNDENRHEYELKIQTVREKYQFKTKAVDKDFKALAQLYQGKFSTNIHFM